MNHPTEESPWPAAKAWEWHQRQPWLIGCNYCPAYAVNQIEMWQDGTFDPEAIDRELSWAEGIGFNLLRVFLHDLLYFDNPGGFLKKLDRFLHIADRRGMRVMPVFFDSVWHPQPRLGKQRDPEPFVHNSGWVQSPGIEALRSPEAFAHLEEYVRTVTSHFAKDPRVAVWDIWNEPDNANSSSYGPRDLGEVKNDLVYPLLARAFDWVRRAKPSQPVISGVWHGNWRHPESCHPVVRLQLETQDLLSFHCYAGPAETSERVKALKTFGRPLLCTEYLARGVGSCFEEILPLFRKDKIGAVNWGLVKGRTQTHMPWSSWQQRFEADPDPWHHEIFQPDGHPYRTEETECIARWAHGTD